MTREVGMATKADLERRKNWEAHVSSCKLKDCNHCEPHKWIEIEKVRKWVIENSTQNRVVSFIDSQKLLNFLRK